MMQLSMLASQILSLVPVITIGQDEWESFKEKFTEEELDAVSAVGFHSSYVA